MKKLLNFRPLPLLLALVFVGAVVVFAGVNDRFSGINLGSQTHRALTNVIEIPRMSTPTQNPPSGYIWLYARWVSDETHLRIRDENGADGQFTVTSYY